jgi:copper(I)-binding protein
VKSASFALMTCALALMATAAGCQRPDDRTTADTNQEKAASIPAAAADTSPLAVTDGYLVLPAVPGRPGAAYFTVANRTDHPATLVAVAIAGARQAEMHQTSGGGMEALASVDIPSHGTIAFAPGGRHVMVFGLPADLHAGGTSALTLNFKGGEKLSKMLTARAAGGATGAGTGGAMPGMKMN